MIRIFSILKNFLFTSKNRDDVTLSLLRKIEHIEIDPEFEAARGREIYFEDWNAINKALSPHTRG